MWFISILFCVYWLREEFSQLMPIFKSQLSNLSLITLLTELSECVKSYKWRMTCLCLCLWSLPGFEALQNTVWRPLFCLIHTCMNILLAWHWHEQKNLSTVHYWTSTFCVSVYRHTLAAFRRELATKCWIIDALHSFIFNLKLYTLCYFCQKCY